MSARWSPTRPPATGPSRRPTFATLNEMYGNRTICGIGRGDSAVRVTNGAPTTPEDAARVDPRHPRARATPGRSSTTARRCSSRGARGSDARGVGGRLRPARAQARRRGGRRLHPAAGRPRHRRVDDQDGAGCRGERRPRPRLAVKFCVAAPMYIGDGLGAHARPVPLVRRHGGQPRGRHRREVRRGFAPCPRRSPTTSRAGRTTTTTSTARPATCTPTSCPTRSSTGSACSAPRSDHIEKLRGAQGHRRRPVRRLPAARQQRGDAAGLRGDRDPRDGRPHRGEGMTQAVQTQRPPAPRGQARRGQAPSRRVLTGALGVLALAALWELYKLLGPADGIVVGGTTLLPRTSDLAMPHIWVMVGAPLRAGHGRIHRHPALAGRAGGLAVHPEHRRGRLARRGQRRADAGAADAAVPGRRGGRAALDRAQPDRAADRPRPARAARGDRRSTSASSPG